MSGILRTVTLGDHRVSVKLEPIFWRALEKIAFHRETGVAAIINSIDDGKGNDNRASAIRCFCMTYFLNKLKDFE